MIDVGDYFDTAVQSLALHVGASMTLGGTYQSTMTVDHCARAGRPCWSCMSPVSDRAVLQRLRPHLIAQLHSIDFIPPDAKPVYVTACSHMLMIMLRVLTRACRGASNVFVASTCSSMMVAAWCQALHGHAVPSRLIFYYLTFEVDKWPCELVPDCALCGAQPATSPQP